MARSNNYDEEDALVYMLYFEGKMYAWTTSKKMRNAFLDQRDRSKFTQKKEVLDPITMKAFHQKYKEQELIKIPLDSKQGNLEIIGTYAEDTMYSIDADQLVNELNDLIDYFDDDYYLNEGLPSKYSKAVEDLLQVYTHERKPGFDETYVKLDGIAIFFQRFKNIF